MPRRTTPCGPLDLGDAHAYIPTDHVPEDQIHAALAAATHSPAYDGPPLAPDHEGPVALGTRTVAKAQHREHELLQTALWFADLGPSTGIPVPELLDHGTAPATAGARWWLILERVHGQPSREPNAKRQHALGAALRTWHEEAPLAGLALDDPGGLGIMLGSARKFHPPVYPRFAELFAQVCQGLPMTSIHGDVAVGHNALYTDDGQLAALLDPGAVHIAPPAFDLAWALAVDLPRGAQRGPLLDAYGRDAADLDTLDALLPYFLLRRLLDCYVLKEFDDARWLHAELTHRAPHLLDLPGVPPEQT